MIGLRVDVKGKLVHRRWVAVDEVGLDQLDLPPHCFELGEFEAREEDVVPVHGEALGALSPAVAQWKLIGKFGSEMHPGTETMFADAAGGVTRDGRRPVGCLLVVDDER